MNNNLKNLISFFQTDKGVLIINKISEEIECFYLYMIEYYALKFDTFILFDSNNLGGVCNDLFGRKEIKIIFTSSQSQVEKIINNNEKKILITNYKLYKKFNLKQLFINTYNFKSDVIDFLNNELNISNSTLTNNIISHPQFTYSEISKFILNAKVSLIEIDNSQDQLLEIRKKIYQSKNDNNINLKLMFDLLKDEVKYKKFSL